jgi:hypothetical protein
MGKGPTHLLGGAGIHTLSVTADGGCQLVMAMVPYYFTTKQVVFYPSEPPFRKRGSREHHTIHYYCIIHRSLCATRSRYTLLRYNSNFEENEHEQVMRYCEASTFLLSAYLLYFHRLFSLCSTMHSMAIEFNSISPVSRSVIHFYNYSWAHKPLVIRWDT